MTANLAAHQEPLGRSFRRERLAQGRYVMAWFGFEPMFFEWSVGLEASVFNHSATTLSSVTSQQDD